jgi:hypothetical protein
MCSVIQVLLFLDKGLASGNTSFFKQISLLAKANLRLALLIYNLFESTHSL